ncbi:hypothetical protein TIFTF001_020269 [Ficus carica]|uniref:Uncharacterized protein n=1 Tax=Ficus carica TaxID=3494 RepID=A0AA88AI36_FICCA|nr:hypothetical protein TIFTF001_020269 [Ficus carica]
MADEMIKYYVMILAVSSRYFSTGNYKVLHQDAGGLRPATSKYHGRIPTVTCQKSSVIKISSVHQATPVS